MKARLKDRLCRTPAGRAAWRIARLVKFELGRIPRELAGLAACFRKPDGCLPMQTCGTRNRQNWGDDLNIFFLEAATGKRVVPFLGSWLLRLAGRENYMCIGSTIASWPLTATVVWGAGLINDCQGLELLARPRRILAVRGPLTRDWLLRQGADCPAVYGDPALLLPRFYQPVPCGHWRIGLVPHYSDVEKIPPALRRLAAGSAMKSIAVRGYEDWRRGIDEITSCDLIVSSSLHGLIVAEAYGIPAVWVEFGPSIPGWDFKFRDFYASIGKPGVRPFQVREATPPEELWACRKDWVPAQLNLEPLLAVCPFSLSSFA